MTEEEKAQWKIKIYRDCEDMEDRINANLLLVQEERLMIKNALSSTNAVLSNY